MMKKFMVYVVENGTDKYMGSVNVSNGSVDKAMSLIPQHIKDMGKIVLVPVHIEG